MAGLIIKPGVDLNNLKPEILSTVPVVMNIFSMYGVRPTITSGTDGTHSVKSLHYKGLALDWRTRELPGGSGGETAKEVHQIIKAALGEKYDVVLEKTHIHIEYDPK